jgi:hypothetical protein
LVVVFAGEVRCAEKKEEVKSNELCYVCHFDMISEDITNIHIKEDVACVDCHGVSKHHMHDEMLMTKPDLLFGRTEVPGLCKHCHGSDSHKGKGAKIEAFRKEWLGKDRPNGRSINEESICTDCHGTHNIITKLGGKDDEEDAEWIAAFNGEDFAGWTKEGDAEWVIKRGRIVGTPGKKGATLWTKDEYEDCLVAVTFKAEWPVEAGIVLRGGGKESGPEIKIFDSHLPLAYTGTVSIAGKGFSLVNLDKELVRYMSWNTLSMKIEGGKVTVWLNGEEIGSVRVGGPTKGKIGLFLAGGQGDKAELTVNEVQVQRLK